jgi:hypothetical protein
MINWEVFGRIEENHETFRQDCRCLGRESNPAPPKFDSCALPLDQPVRFILLPSTSVHMEFLPCAVELTACIGFCAIMGLLFAKREGAVRVGARCL